MTQSATASSAGLPPDMAGAVQTNPAPTIGSLTDPGATTPPTSTPSADPAPAPSLAAEPPAPTGDSLLDEPLVVEPKTDAPAEGYADFKLPEGFTLADETKTKVTGLFKELGLSQEQAQKLVDFHAEQLTANASGAEAAAQAMRNEWRETAVKNPAIGTGSQLKPEVRTTIAKAIDGLGPDLAKSFRQAMNITGAGDNPAFIEAFYALARERTEGRPLAAPQPAPVANPGKPRDAAHALYPNLP